jgi:hypothetical protein
MNPETPLRIAARELLEWIESSLKPDERPMELCQALSEALNQLKT